MDKFKIGDFVQVCEWTGRIINIFDDSLSPQSPLFQIRFVKNIVKIQADEFHPWRFLVEHIKTATEQDYTNEYERMVKAQEARFHLSLVP